MDESGVFRPTMEPGTSARDPDPIQRDSSGRAITSEGCPIVNADDLRALAPSPDPRRNSGCCGHDGLDGPNLLCPKCGQEVATLRDDCWSFVEVRLEPMAVVQKEALYG
jgi:hypothetical protein